MLSVPWKRGVGEALAVLTGVPSLGRCQILGVGPSDVFKEASR